MKGMDIAVNCFKLIENFPPSGRYALSQQIAKAGVSIPSNVAEDSSRLSPKDYRRFIEISLGSSFELETQILIAESVKFGDSTLRGSLLKDLDEEQKMLISFMNKLNK